MRTVLLLEAVFLMMGRRCEVRITWAMWFIAICFEIGLLVILREGEG